MKGRGGNGFYLSLFILIGLAFILGAFVIPAM